MMGGMNENSGYTSHPTNTFRWFPLPPDIFDALGRPKNKELRQAFSCSDGKTRWRAVPIATEAEQQEEVMP